MVTNEKSQLVDAIHYFPYGEVWLEERPSSLPADYFFTAKEFDPETGFYNFGVRYLDPRFSKWMTADPALGGYLSANKLAPATLALYTYGLHNPAKFNDPSGALPDDPNNTASQSTYLALGQWPRLYKQVLASNNVRLKDLEDAAIEGRLKDIGSFPGKNFWGMIGEALEADRIMATGQSRSAARSTRRVGDSAGGCPVAMCQARLWSLDAIGLCTSSN